MATKKKSPTETMMDNLPKPQTQPTQQVSLSSHAAPPVQRIDLSKDQNVANYIRGAMGRADDLQRAKDTPLVIRDRKTGNPTGVKMPDGKTYQGNYEVVQSLIEGYNNLNPGKGNPVKLFPGDKIRDSYNPRDFAPGQITPDPIVSENQLREVGQTEAAGPNELSADIARQIATRKAVNESPYDEFGNINPALEAYWDSEGKMPPPPGLNKLTSFLPSGKFKDAVLNLLSNKPAMREYLSDYNQDENYNRILVDLQSAEENKQAAINMAANPELTTFAIKNYNDALSRIMRIDAQLKMIEDNDQRKYVDDIIRKRQEIANYFAYGKANDDVKMLQSLNGLNNQGGQI